ncbi:MAG TPA: integrin alpha, partial [Gaiellaceae bacterium]|nr:integrin alpha [Gaiellaceae bacterium]
MRAASVVAALLAAVAAAGSSAEPLLLPQQRGRVDLGLEANLALPGALPGDEAGEAVAGPGDVTGDGLADLLVGAPSADANGRPLSGSAFLVSGRPAPGTVELSVLGPAGLRFDGASAGDRA